MLDPLVSFLSPCLSIQMVFNFGKSLFVVSTCVFVVSSIMYICHLRCTLLQLGSLQLYVCKNTACMAISFSAVV